jgi:S-DNA-T family DNA segregation ATPase FtsK/SpoIIIE
LGFVLIDPKRRAFGPLAGLPHLLRPVISEPEMICGTLKRLVDLMLARDRTNRPITDTDRDGELRVVVVIDELADLLMMAGSEAQIAVTRLVQRGRSAGIHVVACTQKPAARIVGSLAKANFPVRLVGRVTSPEDAKVATGYGGTGAERLLGRGDFIAVNGAQITRFQAAYVSARELADLVCQLLGTDHLIASTTSPTAANVRRVGSVDSYQHVQRRELTATASLSRIAAGARRRFETPAWPRQK